MLFQVEESLLSSWINLLNNGFFSRKLNRGNSFVYVKSRFS
jgi:hypothetical protein